MSRRWVIGLGNRDRGDDAVGPVVVEHLQRCDFASVQLVVWSGDLSGLLDLWAGAERVILIDAIRSGLPPGAVRRFVFLPSSKASLHPQIRSLSSHGLDLVWVIELGQTLGTFPRELVIYGVEGKVFEPGRGLSPEVACVVPYLVRRVQIELRRSSPP